MYRWCASDRAGLAQEFPSLLHRRSRASTLPFLPGLGVGGLLAVFLSLLFRVGIGGPYCCPAPLGPCLWVIRDCSDIGNFDAWPLAPCPAVTNPIQPQPEFWISLFFVLWWRVSFELWPPVLQFRNISGQIWLLWWVSHWRVVGHRGGGGYLHMHSRPSKPLCTCSKASRGGILTLATQRVALVELRPFATR